MHGMTSQYASTVADGVYCARLWQRGDVAPLDRWEKTYLTSRGRRIMCRLREATSESQVAALVRRAVRAN